MKFLFNFLFFGLLFFVIHKFLPDAFDTLVSAVNWVYNFLEGIVLTIVDKINGIKKEA